jgi:hypothetical protein
MSWRKRPGRTVSLFSFFSRHFRQAIRFIPEQDLQPHFYGTD